MEDWLYNKYFSSYFCHYCRKDVSYIVRNMHNDSYQHRYYLNISKKWFNNRRYSWIIPVVIYHNPIHHFNNLELGVRMNDINDIILFLKQCDIKSFEEISSLKFYIVFTYKNNLSFVLFITPNNLYLDL